MCVSYFLFLTAYDLTHRTPRVHTQFYNKHFTYTDNMLNGPYYAFLIVYTETTTNTLFGDFSPPQAVCLLLYDSTLSKDGLNAS